MTLARNLGAVVLATAWLLSVPQGTLSQANAQAQSPSPGPSDRATAIPDQKLDAAAAFRNRFRPAIFDRYIAAFDETSFAQPIEKGGQRPLIALG